MAESISGQLRCQTEDDYRFLLETSSSFRMLQPLLLLLPPLPPQTCLTPASHLYTRLIITANITFYSFFPRCTIVAVVVVLWPVAAIHQPRPGASPHEPDTLIPCLNYCLNEQETRTRTATALPSFTRPLSVSHPSSSRFHFCSFSSFNYPRLPAVFLLALIRFNCDLKLFLIFTFLLHHEI